MEHRVHTDFQDPANVQAFAHALDVVAGQLGRAYPLEIGGERILTERKISSYNPSNANQVVGYVAKADERLAQRAMEQALTAFDMWRRKLPALRARYLLKAAAIMRRRQHELSAWMCYEAGKTWHEADVETAAAIAFLEQCGRGATRLGDANFPMWDRDGAIEQRDVPLGVGIVISASNSPLAMLTATVASAVVTGNTVILKPASTTPVVAAKLVEVMRQAGLPDGVVNFLPGRGDEVGAYLVDHPQIRFVSFAGSKDVGIQIHERAAKVQPGQKGFKRVVADIHGSDAIVVDEDADVEEAAQHIVHSAFGSAGPMGFVCSRSVLHESIYDEVAERVVELTQALRVGPGTHPFSVVGPVVDADAYNTTLEYIAVGKAEGKCLFGGGKMPGDGYFIEPTVIGDVESSAKMANDSVPGPVVALICAADFEAAIRIANDTTFGRAGAVFSNNRDHLEYARAAYQVTTLYLNGTDARTVDGLQPFGGLHLAGPTSTAVGRHYLRLFTQAQTTSERL